MFSKPTVFVLGAGASKDYKFPLGGTLKEQILSLLNYTTDGWGNFQDATDANRFCNAIVQGNIWGLDGQAFSDAAKIIKAGLPGKLSIDAFIELRNGEEHVTKLAKLAIAYLIIKAEQGSSFALDERKYNFQNLLEQNSWYHKLWHILSDRLRRDKVSNLFNPKINPVTFITFNYDRSLEHFLFYMLMNTYGLSREETASVLQGMKIIHVYGQVGALEWQYTDATKIEFGDHENLFYRAPNSSTTYLEAIAKQLLTYTEEIEDIEAIRKIHEVVYTAANLFFIGFGYHRQNMGLIFPLDAVRATNCKGSGIGVPMLTRLSVAQAIRSKCANPSISVEELITNQDAYKFITENESLMQNYQIIPRKLKVQQ